MPDALSRSTELAYAAGAVGTAIFGTVPGLLLLFFMTDTLGVAPGLAGVALAMGKLWDVVCDPLVGALSDRTDSRLGRRRPWLLAGAVLLPITFVALFAVPDFATPDARFAWVACWFVLASTAFAVFQVPYVAMPAEMTGDPARQTVLMAWRMGAMVVGILIAGGAAPLLVRAGGGGREGYAVMGAVLGGVCAVMMATAFAGTGCAPTAAPLRGTPVRAQLAAVWRNRAFRALAGALVLQLTGVSALLAVVPYVAQWLLGGGETTVTVLFLCLVGPALVGMPLWVAIDRRVGKLVGWAVAVATYALLGLGLAVSAPGRLPYVAGVVVLMGLAYGGTQVFPFALLPDAIAAGRSQSGVEQGGLLAGLLTASEKCGNALGALVAGLVLQVSGFREAGGGAVEQPQSALLGIRLAASVVPALLLLSSLPVIAWWHRTTRMLRS